MALNREFVGRTYRPPEVYEVTREKIREYALATGETDPVYFDPAAARAGGHPDVVAPPTFFNVLFFRLGSWPLYEPDFGKRKQPMCVHYGQAVRHVRPIHAGDRLVQISRLRSLRDIGEHEEFVIEHEILTEDSEPVAWAENTIVSRGTARKGEPHDDDAVQRDPDRSEAPGTDDRGQPRESAAVLRRDQRLRGYALQ